MPSTDARIRIHFDQGDRAGLDAIKEARQEYEALETAIQKSKLALRTFASEAHREEFVVRAPTVADVGGSSAGSSPRRAASPRLSQQDRDEDYAARQQRREQKERDAQTKRQQAQQERDEAYADRQQAKEKKERERQSKTQQAQQDRDESLYDKLQVREKKEREAKFRKEQAQQERDENYFDRQQRADEAKEQSDRELAEIRVKKQRQARWGLESNTPALGMVSPMAGRLAGIASAAMNPSAPAAMAAALAFKALEAGANMAASGINIMQNSALTAGQKNEMLAKAIIPGYEALARLRDAINGTTEALRRQRVQYERNIFVGEARTNEALRIAPLQNRLTEMQANAASVAALPYDQREVGSFDRNSAEGQFQYGVYARQYETGLQRTRTQREIRTAQAVEETAGDRVFQQRSRTINARTRAEEAGHNYRLEVERQNATGIQNPQRLTDAANARDEANRAVQQEELRLQQALTQQDAARNNLIQARGRLNENNVQRMRDELTTLQEQRQRMEAGADRFGRMNQGTRMMAEQAAAMVRSAGIDNVPDQVRELARQYDPAMVGRLERVSGEGAAQRAADQGNETEFAFRGGATIAGTRQREERLQANIQNQININEATMAQEIANRLGPTVRGLIESIRSQVQGQLNQQQSGVAQSNANQQ